MHTIPLANSVTNSTIKTCPQISTSLVMIASSLFFISTDINKSGRHSIEVENQYLPLSLIKEKKDGKARIPGIIQLTATYSDDDKDLISVDVAPSSEEEAGKFRTEKHDETHDDDPHKGKVRMDCLDDQGRDKNQSKDDVLPEKCSDFTIKRKEENEKKQKKEEKKDAYASAMKQFAPDADGKAVFDNSQVNWDDIMNQQQVDHSYKNED